MISEDTAHQPTRTRARVGDGHKIERKSGRDALCWSRCVDIRENYAAKNNAQLQTHVVIRRGAPVYSPRKAMKLEVVYEQNGADLNTRRLKRPPLTLTGGSRRLSVYDRTISACQWEGE